jgi:hypothetical protein
MGKLAIEDEVYTLHHILYTRSNRVSTQFLVDGRCPEYAFLSYIDTPGYRSILQNMIVSLQKLMSHAWSGIFTLRY